MNEGVQAGNLTAYPNPTTGVLTTTVALDRPTRHRSDAIHLTVYDNAGRLVHYDRLTAERGQRELRHTIDLTTLPTGPYFLHASTDDRRLGSQRVVVRR